MVRIASPVFVGRVAEQLMLDEALDSAAQGSTTTILIGGDAGLGKSRLLETWSARAGEHGAKIASGSCLDLGEGGPAYVALVQAFRDLLRPLAPSAVDALVGSDRSTVALVIPELAVYTGLADERQASAPISQTRLFDRLVRVLERASWDGPLVLELEDIHWADPSTRAFLQYLVANSRAAKLLIVATFRAEEAGREHPLTSLLRQVVRHRGVRRIDLLPFDTDELRQQLHAILGEAPTSRLLAAIHARTEGNALFVEELIASGDPTVELPSSIGAALLVRTAGLSSSALETLRVASVAGRATPYDVLKSAMSLADDRLDAALREVVDANVLEPDHAGERYRFRHALLQEAVYQEILPGERRRLHGVVAQALAGHAEDRLNDPELVSQLAYHWSEAKNHEQALKACLSAGDTALRRAAYVEAHHHYERVLELWDHAPLARADVRRVDVLERASRCAWLAGKPDKTVGYAQRGLDELDVTGDAIVRVRLLDQLTRALHSMTDDAVEQTMLLAGIELDGLPVREQLIVLDARVRTLRWAGDQAGSNVAALEALHIAEASDDHESKADAHLIMAWTLLSGRDYEGALREARRASEYAARAGHARAEAQALRLVAGIYEETSQYESAIAAAREARARAEQVGLSHREGSWASFFEAKATFEMGGITESARVIEAALMDPPDGWALRRLHALAAQVSIVLGSFEDAARHIEAARIPSATPEDEDRRGYLAIVRAELARSQNRLEDVRAIIEAAAPGVIRFPNDPDINEMIWRLVEIGLDVEAVRAELGRAADDAAAVDQAKESATTLVGYLTVVRRQREAERVRDATRQRAEDALIEGHLARIEDRDDPSLWATAAAMFPPRSPHALRAHYLQAEAMLAARVPRDEIRAVMADAHAIAVEIGAGPLAGRFEALARRARISLLRTPATVPAGEPAANPEEPEPPGVLALRGRGLSDREIEVLTLVAAGFSNHEIGARLFISDKTSSVHVSHILAKLGAASRTEAATIGVRLGLPDLERDNRSSG